VPLSQRSLRALPVRRSAGPPAMAVLVLAVLISGCGFSQGQLLYFMGFGSGRTAEAEFELTREGPVVILVDDFEQHLDSPQTGMLLAGQLARQLEDNDAADDVVPQAVINKLRASRSRFEELTSRKIGELVGAHQVIYIMVRDYYSPAEVEELASAARLSVTVKVLNVLEKKDRTRVRLWPSEREGRLVTVELNANVVMKAKTPEVAGKILAANMAEEVAKLFYEYPLDDFE